MKLAAALCLGLLMLAGCEREAQQQAGPSESRAGVSMVGAWATETPATFSGEGFRTETTDGRTRYRPDGGFAYTGRLTIHGQQLPAGGIPFRIEADGKWQRRERALIERFTDVRVTPEVPNPVLGRLADQLAAEMEAGAPSQADILEISDTGLQLRDKASGKVSTYSKVS